MNEPVGESVLTIVTDYAREWDSASTDTPYFQPPRRSANQ